MEPIVGTLGCAIASGNKQDAARRKMSVEQKSFCFMVIKLQKRDYLLPPGGQRATLPSFADRIKGFLLLLIKRVQV